MFAGIVAGNLTIAATAVLGTSNITVTGSGLSWALALTGFESLESATKLATELADNGGVLPYLCGN